MIVNISEAKTNLSKLEAKTNLSKLVNMACHGEEVIIAKNNLPLVEIIPHKLKGKRTLGILVGKMDVPDDIMDEDEVLNEMFYGRSEADKQEKR